jgi:DNA-binding NtrC family response regulator
LEEMVENGDFREDLYYRLNVVTIRLPSLCERRDDIPLLVQHFLTALCETTGKADIAVDPEVMRFFQTFVWPGNVRQLRNCLESMVVLADDNKLTLANLPATIRKGPDTKTDVEIPAGTTLQELERTAVEKALEQFGGNRTHAALSLGISVRTLQRKIRAWGIDDPEIQSQVE